MMEGTQVGSVGAECGGFKNQHNAAKVLLRQNYVNQYKSYYDGGFNSQRWRSHVFTRLRRVNQSWDIQYSSFGEFREKCRKVTFNDDVTFHDFISDSELETEDMNISGENANCNVSNNLDGIDPLEIENPDLMAYSPEKYDVDTFYMPTEPEPFKCAPMTTIRELPEDDLHIENVALPVSAMQNDILTPKSDSVPNLTTETDNIIDHDLKPSRSDSIMNDSNITKKSPKNRAGTPRYLNRTSYYDSHTDGCQIKEIGSNGIGDEKNKNEKTDMKSHTEGDTFERISSEQRPSDTLLTTEDLVSPAKIFETGIIANQNQKQDNIEENQLSLTTIETYPPVKESIRKSKRISKSRSDMNKNKSPKKDTKTGKKEKPTKVYVRRENARIQGQRLFYEIKDQISKHNVDKNILSTIFNKQFLALLLSSESVRKYRTGLDSNPVVDWPPQTKARTNKVITLGSKWATKPVENIQVAAINKTPVALPHVVPKRSKNSKLNTETANLTPRLQKEKVGDIKPKLELNNKSVNTEKMKQLSVPKSSPRKMSSPKKETNEKTQKRSRPREKSAERTEKNNRPKNASLKNEKPMKEDAVVNQSEPLETKTVVKDPKKISTKIPKPISKSINDRRTNLHSADQEKRSMSSVFHEKIDSPRRAPNTRARSSERPFTAPPTNPLDYASFDRWLTESKKIENRSSGHGDTHTWKLSVGDERELKILRSIKRNPQMLDAYTTYRFGGPLSPIELERLIKRF